MLRRVLYILNQFSISDSLIRVNHLFFTSDRANSDLLRLQDNFVFRHACMTPLTIITCALENLGSVTSASEKQNNIQSAKDAIGYITKLILAVTKSENKEQDFCVNTAMNEVIFLFKSKTGSSVFYSNFLPKKLKLFGNKLYFQEIIICLLNNAHEAYQDKTVVHISMSVRVIKDQVFIGVVDFAKGMTSLGQKLAVLKGVSYKENGLGLGLSFVKQTIENVFNGDFKIMSGYGVGTHVQVAIPIPKPCNQNPLQS